MKVSELIGAELDFWTARAEVVPAAELEIRPVQRPDPRTPDTICVRKIGTTLIIRLDYSTNPSLWGPLIKKHTIAVSKGSNQTNFPGWYARLGLRALYHGVDGSFGEEPEIAICRAVVRSVFGDYVEDLP